MTTIGRGVTIQNGVTFEQGVVPFVPKFYSFNPFEPGLVRTSNLGTTWTSPGASMPVYPYGIQRVREENGVIIASGFGYGSPQPHYIYRSANEGATLTTITLTDKLSSAPFSVSRVGDTWISSTGNGGNYYSTDNGATWQTSHNSYAVSQNVAAGTSSFLSVDGNGPQLIRSTDGINWATIGTSPAFVIPDTYPYLIFDGTRWIAISAKGEIAYTPNETTFTWTTSSHPLSYTLPSYPPGWVDEGSTMHFLPLDATYLADGTAVILMTYFGYTADFSIFISGAAIFAGTASGTWTGTFFADIGINPPIHVKGGYMMLGFVDNPTGLPLLPRISTDGITWTEVTSSGYGSVF